MICLNHLFPSQLRYFLILTYTSPSVQMARALSQAKASEGKFKRRDFIAAIKNANQGSEIPPFIVEINRASLHNGKSKITKDNMI